MRRLAAWAALLVLLLAALQVRPLRAAGLDLSAPLPVDPAVRMVELSNGLKCWVRANKTPPGKVGIWMHVGSGSVNEDDDQRGLAHFVEHLAFDGSANFPPGTLVKYFESIGLRFGNDQNAFTGFDETTYVLTLPDTKEETIRKGLLCMADFAFRLTMPPEEIDKERKVILEEARARKGVSQRLREKLLPILLPGSRVAERLPIGKEEVIKTASRELLGSYYKKCYRPDDTTLLVVGDIAPANVEAMVDEAFKDWPAVPNPPKNADPGIKPYAETRAAVVTDPELTAADSSAVAVRPMEQLLTVGDFRRNLVDEIGMWIVNRRLEEMIQKGTAPFREAEVSKHPFLNVCTYIEASATGEPGEWSPMLQAVLNALKQARECGFLAQEFADAKKALIASAEQAARTEPTRESRNFLSYMNDLVAEGRKPMSASQRLDLLKELIETLRVDEAEAAFRKNFDAEARVLLITMPEKSGLAAPSDQEVLSVAKQAEAAQVAAPVATKRPERLLEKEPTLGTVVEQAEDPDLQILSVTMGNGVRAHLRSMEFKKGEVLVKMTLAGGVILETRRSRGLTDAAALAFRQPATDTLSSTEIRELMTGKNVSLSADVGSDFVGIGIRGSPDDVEEGFRLAYLLLTQPRIEASALKFWRQHAIEEIESRRTNVEAQLMEKARALLSGDDPRFKPLTRQQVEGLDLGDGELWLRRTVRSAPMEVAIVGDIERSRALSLALKYLGSLPKRPPVHLAFDSLRKLNLNRGPLADTVEVETITPRAELLAGWRGANWAPVKDRRGLQVAAMILNSRLRDEVREKLGLTYSIYCDARPAKAYPGTGLFAASATTDPHKATEAADICRAMMEQFAAKGPTEEEMATVHKQFANILETSQKEPAYWADVLSDLDYHGTLLSDVKEALQKYTSYTAEDVLEVVGRYVTEARRIQVIALPVEKPKASEAPSPAQPQDAVLVK
jgi:zinc protease